MKSYDEFIKDKSLAFKPCGFDVDEADLVDALFDFQRRIVRWSLKRGKCAIFAECGLGKTLMQLEWANQVFKNTGENVILFVPPAVAGQTVEEGLKFGIPVNRCKTADDIQPGINITNYERLHHFADDDNNPIHKWGAIVLDESSILKGFDGHYRKALSKFASSIDYRLACTATPAPNDIVELCNHSDFLGVMSEKQVKALFFKQGMEQDTVHQWRLKGHAKNDFYKWLSSWAIAIRRPSDIGFSDEGFILPELNIQQISVEVEQENLSTLFALEAKTLNDRRQARRDSLAQRVEAAAELTKDSDQSWLVWCDLNAESSALASAIQDAYEVTGSDTTEYKEQVFSEFTHGDVRILVSKPSIAGLGMNWQHCSNMIFVGLSDSFELMYQAIRRCWRFGQKKQVNVYIVTSNLEGAVVRNIQRKEKQAEEMFEELVKHMKDVQLEQVKRDEEQYKTATEHGKGWTLYLGDCVDRMKEVDDDSIGLTVTSIPFANMYSYTNSPRDMGNNQSTSQLMRHLRFLMKDLLRATKPGRNCVIHLTQEPIFKHEAGHIGFRDSVGAVIRLMARCGWIPFREVTIDKNPQVKATRTKDITLLFKTLAKDSAMSGMAFADYLLIFKKPGDNEEPIHAGRHARWNPNDGWITPEEWCRWARPVWYGADWNPDMELEEYDYYPIIGYEPNPNWTLAMPVLGNPIYAEKPIKRYRWVKVSDSDPGIKETDVLNVAMAREGEDERHLCPLQLGVIERSIKLWSNPGDLICDPFNGIGSTGVKALELHRHYVGIELKESYYRQSIRNLSNAENNGGQTSIFDLQPELDLQVV